MTTNSYSILPSTIPTGEKVYRVDTNRNHTADDSDPILIHQTQDGWKPVTALDQPVDRFTVEKDYGFWGDKELSHKEGWPWNRHKVVDRPLDGKIQPDEIRADGFHRLGDGINGPNKYELGGEIEKDSQGRFYLNEKFQLYPDMLIIREGDIKDMEGMRADDNNWRVPSHQA